MAVVQWIGDDRNEPCWKRLLVRHTRWEDKWQIKAATLERIPEAEPGRGHVNTTSFPASQFTVTHRLAGMKCCAPLNYGLVEGARFPAEAPNYFRF